ncbi:alpha-xenorhabdolysin family binary toxin subunit A [Pseudomonas sp. DWP3-1-2]|uniref:alpha-xenorhabdolysin family binary toxin subunit A n=1 Tax=Pseudomonas sp. DWP3-1-2 TaxID=2804645 RepID=UPI003CED4BAB
MLNLKDYNEQAISLEDGLEQPIENVLKIDVAEAIQTYVEVSSGLQAKTTRSSGFFIAQQDIGKVKEFTHYAAALPIDLNQVKQYLGYDSSGIPGLEPVDVQALHKEAQGLADFWSDIETRMKNVAADLIVFSVNLETTGKEVINIIKKLGGYQDYSTQLGDVEAAQLPDIKLIDNDHKSIPGLLALSEELLDIVKDYKRKATDVKQRTEYFLVGITELKDKVSSALQALANHNLGGELAEKIEQLQRLNKEIDELSGSYKAYSRYKWVGAWWGPAGLAISMSIYGPEAAKTRKDRDTAIDKKKQLDHEVKRLDHVIGSLIDFQTKLQLLEVLSMEAISGAKNIEDIWLLINSYIIASMTQMKKNTNATTLFIFEKRLIALMGHWTKISEEAGKIIGRTAD